MSATTKYVFYLVLLHVMLAIAVYFAFDGNGLWFLGAEALLLGSAYFAYHLYRSILAPLRLLSRGADALADKDFSVKLVATGSPEMDRLTRVYNHMIDQLRQERVNSRQQEAFLDQILHAARLGILIKNLNGEVARMNPWLRERAADQAFLTRVLQPAMDLPADGQTVLQTPTNRRLSVEAGSFLDRGFERGFLVFQDVTSDLLAAEKEAYGQVIRMMSHEVNNSNAAVLSVLRTLLEAAAANDAELAQLNGDYLPAVIGRAENMAGFMRNFARVVRLPPPDRRSVDLNELLRRTGRLLEPVLAEAAIELVYRLHPRPLHTHADAAQLEQVIVNALTNARESIGSNGIIRLESRANPTTFVIADNGPGIDAATQAQLFTPFFSTKMNGQGVGLTLTRDILEAHGAQYTLRTEGGWTRLVVRFGAN